jgi:hypothetical protein
LNAKPTSLITLRHMANPARFGTFRTIKIINPLLQTGRCTMGCNDVRARTLMLGVRRAGVLAFKLPAFCEPVAATYSQLFGKARHQIKLRGISTHDHPPATRLV